MRRRARTTFGDVRVSRSSAYDTIAGADDFATTLTEDLRAVSHDKHLGVNFSPQVLPKMDSGANTTPDPAAVARRKAQLHRNNCAFEKVERRARPGEHYR